MEQTLAIIQNCINVILVKPLFEKYESGLEINLVIDTILERVSLIGLIHGLEISGESLGNSLQHIE